ncbi:MAG: hypothetical protein IPK19_23150 [Chloroflexi bacterium]|nr:hypothetical protein [Chloroflexota bacterium]
MITATAGGCSVRQSSVATAILSTQGNYTAGQVSQVSGQSPYPATREPRPKLAGSPRTIEQSLANFPEKSSSSAAGKIDRHEIFRLGTGWNINEKKDQIDGRWYHGPPMASKVGWP